MHWPQSVDVPMDENEALETSFTNNVVNEAV